MCILTDMNRQVLQVIICTYNSTRFMRSAQPPNKSRLAADVKKKAPSVPVQSLTIFESFMKASPGEISKLLKRFSSDFLKESESEKSEINKIMKIQGVSETCEIIQKSIESGGICETLKKYFSFSKQSWQSHFIRYQLHNADNKCHIYENILSSVLEVLKQYEKSKWEGDRLNKSKVENFDTSFVEESTIGKIEGLDDVLGRLQMSAIENTSAIDLHNQLSKFQQSSKQQSKQFNEQLETYKMMIKQLSQKEKELVQKCQEAEKLKVQAQRYQEENNQSFKKIRQNEEKLKIELQQRNNRYKIEKLKAEKAKQDYARVQNESMKLRLALKNAQKQIQYIDRTEMQKKIANEKERLRKEGQIDDLNMTIQCLKENLIKVIKQIDLKDQLIVQKEQELSKTKNNYQKKLQNMIQLSKKQLENKVKQQYEKNQESIIKPVFIEISSITESFRRILKQTEYSLSINNNLEQLQQNISNEMNRLIQLKNNIIKDCDKSFTLLGNIIKEVIEMSEVYCKLPIKKEIIKQTQKENQKNQQLKDQLSQLKKQIKKINQQSQKLKQQKQCIQKELDQTQRQTQKIVVNQNQKITELQDKIKTLELNEQIQRLQNTETINTLSKQNKKYQIEVEELRMFKEIPFKLSLILQEERNKAKILMNFIETFMDKKIAKTVFIYNQDPFRSNFSPYLTNKITNFVILFKLLKTQKVIGIFATSITTSKSEQNSDAFIFSLEENGVMFPCKQNHQNHKEVIKYGDNVLKVGNSQLILKNNTADKKIELNTNIIGNRYYRIPNPEALLGKNIQPEKYFEYEELEIHQVFLS